MDWQATPGAHSFSPVFVLSGSLPGAIFIGGMWLIGFYCFYEDTTEEEETMLHSRATLTLTSVKVRTFVRSVTCLD